MREQWDQEWEWNKMESCFCSDRRVVLSCRMYFMCIHSSYLFGGIVAHPRKMPLNKEDKVYSRSSLAALFLWFTVSLPSINRSCHHRNPNSSVCNPLCLLIQFDQLFLFFLSCVFRTDISRKERRRNQLLRTFSVRAQLVQDLITHHSKLRFSFL
jgi:hypothetical protein